MRALRINWVRRGTFSVLCLAVVTACATVIAPAPAAVPAPVPVREQGEAVAYIVRHAEKAVTAQSNPDPDLSRDGRARAQILADRLGQAGVTSIIVTNLKRTGQTAAPLATRLGITPQIVPVTVRSHTDSVALTVLSHRGESVLVVGHTNTVPAIIAALGGPTLRNLCDSEYSDLFVLRISVSGAAKFEHLHYGAADPFDPSCR